MAMLINDYLQKETPWEILVIDDTRLNRAIVRKTLDRMNIAVTEAADGQEGLDILARRRFDLILVDIIMPNLDGFGFLERFKDHVRDEFIPVILMTGSDDLNSKIKGLSIGADDFLLKPLNEKELVARINSLLKLKRAHDELFAKNLQIKKELEIAKKVQQFIIPKSFAQISYPTISGRYLPIEDIGGDYFDCYTLPDGSVGMLIADVTGHGIPAALVMSMSKMIFSIYAANIGSTSELLAAVNREMKGLLLDNQYITAFYVIYHPAANTISFTNAGHTRALYYRKSKNAVLLLDTDGLFVGIADDANYGEKALRVEPGDRLFLYTDGISEVRNAENEEFGEGRIGAFMKARGDLHGDDFCEGLLAELQSFTSLDRRKDDIAFLSIEF